MLENLIAKDFPKESGVYWFVCNDEIIYVGSSRNLYRRMTQHRVSIKAGGNSKGTSKKDLYGFLQSNEFQVGFELTDDFLQTEQQYIEKYNPKFNLLSAYTGLDKKTYNKIWAKIHIESVKTSRKKWNESHKEEKKAANKAYQEEHREGYKQYYKQYKSQLCLYNNVIVTLHALSSRFYRQGIPYPTQEAKKYLISDSDLHITE